MNSLTNPANFRAHPLGFFYNSLEISCAKTIRLHVYPANPSFKAINEWHNHEFELHSTVLKGVLQNDIGSFEATDDGDIQEFSVEYKSGKSIIKSLGTQGEIILTSSFKTTAGESYILPESEIHRAYPVNFPCVTLVVANHKGTPILSYGTKEKPYKRSLVSVSESKEIKEILKTTINLDEYIFDLLK